MVPLARAEARKALELLPSEPLAHAVLGGIAALHDYDWNGGEEQFRLARASESVPPEVSVWYAWYLLALGRFEEAIEEEGKAIAQDPLNVRWRNAKAGALFCAGMYDSAIAEARKALEQGDRSFSPHFQIAASYFFQGKLAEAREPAEEAFRLAPWHSGAVGFLAGILAQSGETDRAEKLLATIRGTIQGGTIMYHLVCSEIDAAIDCYQQVIELRQPIWVMFASARFLKPLRASPRWPKLAKMMNLPEKA